MPNIRGAVTGFHGLPAWQDGIPLKVREAHVKNTKWTAKRLMGLAGLIFAAYVVVTSVPDIVRYVKISAM